MPFDNDFSFFLLFCFAEAFIVFYLKFKHIKKRFQHILLAVFAINNVKKLEFHGE